MLSGANPDVARRLVIHPGIEVRSDSNVKVTADWVLPTAPPGSTIPAGDASLTIRAPGKIDLAYGISAGFSGTTLSDRGGSIRITAGADLTAADIHATVAGAAGAAGDVSIGRTAGLNATGPSVMLRATTGDIELSAAHDIQLVNGSATVYTTGASVDSRLDLSGIDDLSQATASPFLDGGGAIRLRAGHDIGGTAPVAANPYFTAWWWRGPSDGVNVWWSSYDNFSQGFATFGGGDISAHAGHDLLDLHTAAASSGYTLPATGSTAPAMLGRFGGGSVVASAGNDIVNGLFYAGGRTLRLDAGGTIRRGTANGTADPGVQLAYETTAVRVQAAGDVGVASARNAGMTERGNLNNSAETSSVISGLDQGSSLVMQSASGSLVYQSTAQPDASNLPVNNDVATLGNLLPSSVRLAAPNGSLTMGGIAAVQPGAAGVVQVLARDSVQLGGLLVAPSRAPTVPAVVNAPELAPGLDLKVSTPSELFIADGALDGSQRSPVRVVSTDGDVTLNGVLASARPVRVIAGNDITLGFHGRVQVQHQPAMVDAAGVAGAPLSELSLLQAGRDIVASHTANSDSGVSIGGPGDLVVLAGRDIDLGTGLGLVSTGNNDNSTVLPTGGANITAVSGLRADGSDYGRAAREGYALLGGPGLATHAGDLYELLSASPDAGNIASAAAKAFDARPVADQAAAVRSLLGAATDDAARIAFVRGLPKQGALTDAQALDAFAKLSTDEARLAVGAMLARAFGSQPQPVRLAFAAKLALNDASATAGQQRQSFIDYVTAVTGRSQIVLAAATPPASPAVDPLATLQNALSTFEQLPLERQVPWMNGVLIGDLRFYGRQAAATGGADRAAAYARAYLSIDALFPAEAARSGDILLPTSQIRTLQQAGITMMAPGGGVNAGELVGSGSRSAADLGIVTVGGGDISAMVHDSFEVNQSRVFSLREGDILLWASEGNIDAGRGAKTVTGAPAPVLKLDAQGRLTVDASGSFTGSGIAVLDASSFLDLYAPEGEINAGDAGIKSVGGAFIAALSFRGADNLTVLGSGTGLPPPPPSTGATAGLAAAGNAVAAATQPSTEDSDDEKRRKRRARRNLLLDFIGFGSEHS